MTYLGDCRCGRCADCRERWEEGLLCDPHRYEAAFVAAVAEGTRDAVGRSVELIPAICADDRATIRNFHRAGVRPAHVREALTTAKRVRGLEGIDLYRYAIGYLWRRIRAEPRRGGPWTIQEDDVLLKGLMRKHPIAQLASAINRTPRALTSRAERLAAYGACPERWVAEALEALDV